MSGRSGQIDFAIDVPVLIAVLGAPNAADPVKAFGHGYPCMIVACAIGAVAALSNGRVRHTAEPTGDDMVVVHAASA